MGIFEIFRKKESEEKGKKERLKLIHYYIQKTRYRGA